MEVIGKLSNNKIFAYKYLYDNILLNYENFLAVLDKNNKEAVNDYISILYKKMVETDQTDKINRREELKVTSEIFKRDLYKIVIVYITNTSLPYDVSNIGIVVDTVKGDLSYFIRLNKSLYTKGEISNTLYIERNSSEPVGYIENITDEGLTNDFMKFTKRLEVKSDDKSFKGFIDKNLNFDRFKNVSRKNIENLKNLTKENFGRKEINRPEEALDELTRVNNQMSEMMNSMSQDFKLDLNNVNINFSDDINKELNDLTNDINELSKNKVRYYDENGDSSNKKINYINKLSYGNKTKKSEEKMKSQKVSDESEEAYFSVKDTTLNTGITKEEFKPTEEERIVSKIIYNNAWIKEYRDSFEIFDMCDTSNYTEYGVFNTLLMNVLQDYDNNIFDKNISVVNCGRCNNEICPINSYFKVLELYKGEEAKFLKSEFTVVKEEDINKTKIEKVITKINKFDSLSIYIAEFILKSYLIKKLKLSKEDTEETSLYDIEYIDLESLALNSPKYSLIKNLIDINKNDKDVIKDYVKKATIDFDEIEKGNIEEYSAIVKQNPYFLAAYIKYVSEKEGVSLYSIFEEYKNYKYIDAAKSELISRNFDLRINNLFIDEKSKKDLKNIFAYAKKYSAGNLEYIPFNLRLYTDSNDLIEKVSRLLIDALVTYGYIKREIVRIDSFYNVETADKISEIYSDDTVGLIVLKDIYSVENLDKTTKERIINKFEEEVLKSERNVLTIVVDSDKLRIDNALSSSPVLREKVFDFELKMDKVSEQDIYIKLLARLEKTFTVEDEFKVVLLDYINSTFNKSTVSFKEFSDALYEKIVFNSDKETIKVQDVPEFDRNKSNEEIFEELNELIGLENVKEALVDLANLIEFKSKTEGNLKLKSTNLHMVFLGNPGTGKTTVARMIAGILYNLKYIKYNKFIEVSSKDLVAKYVGQTAPKTMEVVEKAMGGVLFIDEAYSLATGNGGEGSFNDECIATLIQAMENYRDNLVVIFAGYKREMQDFLDSNSGIVSRIGYTLDFMDYTVEQLMSIFKQMIDKAGFKITEEALDKAKDIIVEYKATPNFGNARFVRTLYEKVLIKHAKNMKNVDNLDKLRTIDKDDISAENIMKM